MHDQLDHHVKQIKNKITYREDESSISNRRMISPSNRIGLALSDEKK